MPNSLREGWNAIDWKTVEKHVHKLQKKIYRYAKLNEIEKVRKLQKTLLNSYNAKLLAVRKITQDNRGKNSPGIDGISALKPADRLDLATNLAISTHAQPVRRILIPKAGSTEKRPLGIPTIGDRAKQSLVKFVLEPEWEAYFEPNSYGFRPGSNCHDALAQIKSSIVRCPKYVIDADLSKCFDTINHEYLLNKLNQKGEIKNQISAWLKSGYCLFSSQEIFATNKGTPQGGVISPLLANIALHGLENRLKEFVSKIPQNFQTGNRMTSDRDRKSALTVVRYADDFVVTHPDKETLLLCEKYIVEFLKPIGLEINLKKTRFTHTMDKDQSSDGKASFNFLGFIITQKATRIRSINSTIGKALGFRTYIIPSKKSWQKHKEIINGKVKEINNQTSLINTLNPIISGWARYFGISDVYSLKIFQKYNDYLYHKLLRWSYRQTGSIKNGFLKYWKHSGKRWEFTNNEISLVKYTTFARSLLKYTKIKGENSPYDGNDNYWIKRLQNAPLITKQKSKLLSKQQGKCSYCNLQIRSNDIMEIHHILPKFKGGTDKLSNLQVLHGHCHDNIHKSISKITIE